MAEQQEEPPIWPYLNVGTRFTYRTSVPSRITYSVLQKTNNYVCLQEEEEYTRTKRSGFLFHRTNEISCKNIKRYLVDKKGVISDFEFCHQENGLRIPTEGFRPYKTDLFIDPRGLRSKDTVSIDDVLATVTGVTELNGREMVTLSHIHSLYNNFHSHILYLYDLRTGLLFKTQHENGEMIRELQFTNLERF